MCCFLPLLSLSCITRLVFSPEGIELWSFVRRCKCASTPPLPLPASSSRHATRLVTAQVVTEKMCCFLPLLSLSCIDRLVFSPEGNELWALSGTSRIER